MGLSHLCARLRADLLSKQCQWVFSAFGREGWLGAFTDVRGVIDTLDRTDCPESHVALLRNILRERSHDMSGLWTTLVIIAFTPMLVSLRSRIHVDECDSSDVDQIVLEGFLQALASLRVDACARSLLLHIQRRTNRFVFRQLARNRAYMKHQRELEALMADVLDRKLLAADPDCCSGTVTCRFNFSSGSLGQEHNAHVL